MKRPRSSNDDGYLLLGLVVICFLLLLALGVAAPRVAKELERDRELESEHRAQEYVRAIQLYYRKTNSFPTSVDQLLGAGTTGVSSAASVKYLRQKYKDPLTHDEFRLIHTGEAKTQVKGFFGEPLQGLPAGNLGSVAGMQSNFGGATAPNVGGATPGLPGGGSTGFTLGGSSSAAPTTSFGGATPSAGGTSAAGATTGTGTSAAPSTGTGSSGPASADATTFQGSKGAFVGVGSSAKGHGLVEWNGSENIEDWEFLYDPRVELLKAKVSIFGGSPAASGTGSLGSGFAPAGGLPGNVGAPSTGIGGSSGTAATPLSGGGTPTPATPQP